LYSDARAEALVSLFSVAGVQVIALLAGGTEESTFEGGRRGELSLGEELGAWSCPFVSDPFGGVQVWSGLSRFPYIYYTVSARQKQRVETAP
jgi:hypothetical protein